MRASGGDAVTRIDRRRRAARRGRGARVAARRCDGLPVFGYAAIAALLFGAVLLVPMLTVRMLRTRAALRPRGSGHRARAAARTTSACRRLSLASIIVSFSLMVAMAIMVYSFRVSFEHWLGKLLPADMQLREPLGNDTAYWSAADQARPPPSPACRASSSAAPGRCCSIPRGRP